MYHYRTQRSLCGTQVVLTRYDENYTISECDADGCNERNARPVDPADYCPEAPAGTLEAKPADLPQLFVKYPRLKVWHPQVKEIYLTAKIEETMREVHFCEILRHAPHPNVATYKGCLVDEKGFIRGICYARYEQDLERAVNPEHKRKNAFRYGGHPLPHGRDRFLAGLHAGIAHIHRLGYVHCDIKPQNLCVDESGRAVVIDFNSCIAVGAPMKVGRTSGWHDPDAYYAEPEVDDDAVSDVGEWLSKRRTKRYHFVDEEERVGWLSRAEKDSTTEESSSTEERSA